MQLPLKETNTYTYLHLQITPTGNCSAEKELKAKAIQADYLDAEKDTAEKI